jgi:methanogenic corrinoid protein MtbC1
MMKLADQFEKALLALDRLEVRRLFAEGSEAVEPIEVVENLIVPALEHIGEAWVSGQAALAQVYMSGRICEELVDSILPPTSPDRTDQPTMAIAILEDHHLLGKRIVYSILRASGFQLHDFGQVTVEDLVRQVKEIDVKILLISTLMLPSALRIKDVRAQLNSADVKIIVGGAPFRFDEELWQEVGADAFGHSAAEAPEIVRKIVGDLS